MKASRSPCVIRPAGPDPATLPRSIPASRAFFLTEGAAKGLPPLAVWRVDTLPMVSAAREAAEGRVKSGARAGAEGGPDRPSSASVVTAGIETGPDRRVL